MAKVTCSFGSGGCSTALCKESKIYQQIQNIFRKSQKWYYIRILCIRVDFWIRETSARWRYYARSEVLWRFRTLRLDFQFFTFDTFISTGCDLRRPLTYMMTILSTPIPIHFCSPFQKAQNDSRTRTTSHELRCLLWLQMITKLLQWSTWTDIDDMW